MRRSTMISGLIVLSMTASAAVAREFPLAPRVTIEGEYEGAVAVETGDIDGDGVLDVVAAAATDGTLYWWRGAGDGTFTRLTVATPATDFLDIEIVDVDGDGDADLLACAGGAADAVAWYENDGSPVDGGWIFRLVGAGFHEAASVAAGDFDHDGDLDAVGVAYTDGEIAVAFNNYPAPTTFETVDDSFPLARWVAAGDVDGDGDTDVAAASHGAEGEVSWWSRDGVATWTEHEIADVANAAVVELADMDRDGDLDAVVASSDETTIRWYANNGSGGGWTANPVGTAVDTVYSLLAHDLDRDGDLDVLFTEFGVDAVAWWENTDGAGTAWVRRTVDAAFVDAVDVAVGDFDGDGDDDLFAVSVSSGDLAAWENLSIHRSALFPSDRAAGSVDWSNDLTVADVDGDGDLDLLVANDEGQQLVWSENDDGDGSSWTVHVIEDEIDLEALAAADFNGDGLVDVAGCTSSAIAWWASDGGTSWTEHAVPWAESDCRSLKAADFDRDGDVDLVKGSYSSGFDWFENTDGVGGSWSETAVDTGFSWDADCMTTVDVDSDGDVDVVAATEGSVSWMENVIDTFGYIGPRQSILSDVSLVARSVAAGDLDGDGDADVVSFSQTDDTVFWFANTAGDGSTWSAPQTIVSGIDWPRTVALADLDLDGDIDCVVIAESAASACVLAWYENSAGDGSTWTPHQISTQTFRASPLAVADIDRDGDPDLVHDSVDAPARWWPNRGGQAAFASTSSAPATLLPAVLDDVLTIAVSHRGRTGDGELEPSALELGFTDGSDTPLSQAEADALFMGVWIFEDDDDSGDFDPDLDSEVANQVPIVLADGFTTLTLPDDDDHLEVTLSTGRTLFVAVALETGAAWATPNQFKVVHRAEESSAEDRAHDLELLVEHAEDAASTAVTAVALPDEIFSDDFELGNTSAWSTTVGG